ncbi:MAG: hypothetical protein IKE43_08125 [Coriobacteriales bacterium]|nr:hypothetical protein [Coriobacteriales bacterium]
MDMVLPILVGVACGIAGSFPYIFVLRLLKKQRSTSMRPALIAVGISFVLMSGAILMGWFVFRDMLLVFMAALMLSFIIGVAVSLVLFVRKRG